MAKTLIIAEAGVNHNGSVALARQLIDVAVDAGADIVKFQAFRAEDIVTRTVPRAGYQARNTGSVDSQYDLLKALELSPAAFLELKSYCETRGIGFLATPFDPGSLELLIDELGLDRVKISSGDLTNAPLLLAAARRVKRIIISSGMATLDDVRQALGVLAFGFTVTDEVPGIALFERAYASVAGARTLRERVSLLHCTTDYPTLDHDVNLRAMDTLREEFGLCTGLSDHTEGWWASAAAVARGAEIIEKHFTLDRGLPGPDHRASLEPQALCDMVTTIRKIEVAFGSGKKMPTNAERENMPIARKSLVAARPIRRGEVFTPENLAAKRPGSGVAPIHYWDCLGRPALRDYVPDELIDQVDA